MSQMTVQDMDISLNISAGSAANKKTGKDDDFILSLMRSKKNDTVKSKSSNNEKLKSDSVSEANTKKRIKQKSLGTIVKQKLNANSTFNKNQSFDIKKLKTKPQANFEQKQLQQKVATTPNKIDKIDADKNKSSNETSNIPTISFTKVSNENFGKTILAKRRNTTDSKKTLSSIFSKQTESANENVSLLDSFKKIESESVPKSNAKQEFKKESEIASGNKKKKKQTERSKNENDNYVENSRSTSNKSFGKIASLFGHNPEIPNIGQRFVKPINEPVFAGTTFSDLNVHPFMISNLEQNMAITKMTIVQQKAIPQILSGRDVLIRSQTGSGKTLAYALPIVESLHKIRPKLNRNSGLKALIVVPTRELALQTYECFLKLIKPFTWIVPGYLAGGEKRKAEKARLRKGCNILVGTPGRLLDHIKRTAALRLNDVKYFVLDEADRMFDMGYEKDISGIVSALKVSTPGEETSYDAMKMVRGNMKKVFTDEDLEQLENDNDVKNTEDDSEMNDAEDNVQQKQEYHSTDDDSEDDEPYVKSKRLEKRKIPEEKKPDAGRDNDKQRDDDNNSEMDESRRKTILLSATLTQAVEKLAGLAMVHPVFVDAAKENLATTGGDACELNEDLIVPQSVNQSYIVTPPKLRMVTLSAYIAGKCQSQRRQHKILIFMATQDMVDYHTEILSSVLTKPVDEDDDDSEPLVDVEFFKLHGSMTQKERTEVFKTFRLAKSGVLLCTDVAARGLDLPKVDCVIQYTGPTSARDYVHRIGRTARAGSSGSATIFLTPPEIEFVRMLESRRIRIRQESMEDVLDKLLGPLSKHSSAHGAAIALQNEFENMLIEDSKLREKACKAYSSWIRFYSSYPRDMREIFNRRTAHLGHYAKSFALRETPQRIGGIGAKLYRKDSTRQEHNNRLTNEKPDGEPSQKKSQKPRRDEQRTGLLKRVRMLNTSEYDSGLQPAKKPKKS